MFSSYIVVLSSRYCCGAYSDMYELAEFDALVGLYAEGFHMGSRPLNTITSSLKVEVTLIRTFLCLAILNRYPSMWSGASRSALILIDPWPDGVK